jgi:antitoxin CptB
MGNSSASPRFYGQRPRRSNPRLRAPHAIPRISRASRAATRAARAYGTGMTPDESAATERRRRRLLFRATHRGTKENDLMIGGFVADRLATLTDAEMDALEQVMELPDTDLADWLTLRRPIPAEADSPMLRAILAFVAAGGAHGGAGGP